MKKLFYTANIRFPTERAHGIQVAHMCSALAERHESDAERERGTDTERITVTLLVPNRKTFSEDPYKYYGVSRNFAIEKIPVPDIVRFGRVGFFIESLVFAFRATRYVATHISVHPRINQRPSASVVYTREELPLLFLPHGRAFYEAHQLRRSFFFSRLIRRAKGVIAITKGLKDALVRQGIPEERIVVAHDGYDEKQFSNRISKAEARKGLGLPTDATIAMYIGGLEPWKGAEILCKAAASLEQNGILVAIIGGTEKEIDKLQHQYPLIRFLGARPYRELAEHQQAADILVVPNSGEYEISKSFTSPLKLFAHMASGIPIVASRLPSLTEILSEENAYLVMPDDPLSLASGILAALYNPSESAERVKKAATAVGLYSWDKRAKNVLAYIALLCQSEKKSS